MLNTDDHSISVTYESHYLSDFDIANIARNSFAREASRYSTEANNNLIRFLARGVKGEDWNKLVTQAAQGVAEFKLAHELLVMVRSIPEHWVPFGHPQITLNVRAPVPIRVQSFKHKIGFVESEESRRYITSTPKLFIPEDFRERPQNDIKQGSGGAHPDSTNWKSVYIEKANEAIATYESMIEQGVCPEQARFILPQGCMVNWVWTGSLYAYANFYIQRSHSTAQKEIQDVAKEVDSIIRPLFPVAWPALVDGDYLPIALKDLI